MSDLKITPETSPMAVFTQAAGPDAPDTQKDTRKHPKTHKDAPFSMRLTGEERAFLDEVAQGKPWAAYIRGKVFGDMESARQARRRPTGQMVEVAKALGMLGQSRLASNLNQLAKSANRGTLPVGPEVTAELIAACRDIRQMRDALIAALGLKVEG